MDVPLVGHRLAQWEIRELLGLGGAAEVYRAWDAARLEEVALKVLSQRAEPEMVLRFVREGQALAGLHHRHIVTIYGVGEADHRRYIAMELLPGGSLKERLQREPLGWTEAVDVTLQVAQALTCAHAQGIVHRDIKPGNILFDAQGQAKLTDFGLAHLSEASAMTQMGTVMGTVFYLSPEQAAGRPVDGRSDLYALGTVLYEMLVGQPPFTGTSAIGILQKHLSDVPRPVRELDADIPRALGRVVERLLEKEPARRYDDAGQLILALQEVLAQDERPSDVVAGVPAAGDGGSTEDRRAGQMLPIVGREAELGTLSAALDRCLAGGGQTVVLAGEAGVGKTRLTQEVEAMARQRGVRFLRGASVYSDAPNPYAPVVEMLRGYLSSESVGDATGLDEGQRAQLDELRRGVCGVLHVDHPYGRGEPVTWLRESSPQDARAQVFEALIQFFALAARIRPLVLAFDDLQWASPTTIQLFHYLARNVTDVGILLLGSYRPEDVLLGDDGGTHPWREALTRLGREHLAQEVTLGPLDRADAVRLAEQYLDLAVEPDLGERLWREAEGNPLFIIEILDLLLDQGELREALQDESFDLGQLAIPETVRDTIMRRVERISPDDRDLLDWAAVGGPRIDAGLVAAVVGKSRLVVMKQLLAIQRYYGLLRTEGQAFCFAHTKVQQVLYDQLPEPLCGEYHLALAEAIEARAGGKADELVYELARHYLHGGDSAKGYQYLCRAAQKAEQAYALAEATRYLEQALGLAPHVDAPQSELADLEQRYGRLLLTLGRHDDAEAALLAALARHEVAGEGGKQAELLLDLCTAHGRMGDWDGAVALGERSETAAAAMGDALGQARALLATGFFAFEQGHWHVALARLERAADLAATPDAELLQARIWGNMGILYSAQDGLDQAIVLYRRSSEAFERHNDLLDLGRVLNNMGFAYQRSGAVEASRECYRRALEALSRVGDVREQGLVHLHMAEMALQTGDLADAREHCVQANRRFARIGFEPGLADVDRVYAGIAAYQKRWPVAEHYLREALSVYEAFGDQLNIAETHAELGRLLEQVGEGERAAEALQRSRTLYAALRGTAADE